MDTFPDDVQKRIQVWLHSTIDENTKETIRQLQASNPQGLADAFSTDLSFGTGGMRGLMGVGTNRLNVYTIRIATAGLAHYLRRQFQKKPISVVIGFDSRHHSEEFAQEAARVLAAQNIHVFLLRAIRPVPFVSFLCRFKNANAAIMITASHNPAEYNGYKVYWQDGAQVVHPHDQGIVDEVQKIKSLEQVLASLDDPEVERVGKEVDPEYIHALRPLQHFPDANHQYGWKVHIVYTPLHGTGITLAPQALADWGFSKISLVQKQAVPDGNFPTVHYPNPEYPEALQLGTALLQKANADLLIANDPDADRIGVVAMHHGSPVRLNGNEMAALCAEFICASLQKQRRLPKRGALVTTIVSTELIREIAHSYGLAFFEVLTGFKYIGEKIHEWEISPNSYAFLFGAEESYGYLIGTHARDKDAIAMSCLVAEMALQAKLQGKTLRDHLFAIYEKYGVFREMEQSLVFDATQEHLTHIQQMMEELRKHPPQEIMNIPVLYTEDYLTLLRTYADGRPQEKLTLPSSNVLVLRLQDQSRIVVRPSGTEPKLKLYGSTRDKNKGSIQERCSQLDQKLNLLIRDVKSYIHS